MRLPQGDGIRVDKGVVAGSKITPFFDSMVAKLIVHADNREEAILKMFNALRQFQIRGIKTTIPFDKAVMSNEVFQSGQFDTSFIEKDLESTVFREEDEELFAALFSVSSYLKQNTQVLHQVENHDPWVLKNKIYNM
jgi:acetyl/propionyl-CoA carboxylase alpha subunit